MEKKKKYELVREMVKYVRQHHIQHFVDLVEYAADNRINDWFPLLCDDIAYVQMISNMF